LCLIVAKILPQKFKKSPKTIPESSQNLSKNPHNIPTIAVKSLTIRKSFPNSAKFPLNPENQAKMSFNIHGKPQNPCMDILQGF
jgi:hypothetical protein